MFGIVHRPRLCHVKASTRGKGYGFTVIADKTKAGLFVDKVDPDSPAALAGLKVGDRIIEVNGINVEQDNHTQVVERIKSNANETKLLVLDSEVV